MKLATIECATCSALIEVYPDDGPSELAWSVLDADRCNAPPLNRCPYARAEIKQRFPEADL